MSLLKLNGELAVSERQAWQLKSAFQTLVPDEVRREAISTALKKMTFKIK